MKIIFTQKEVFCFPSAQDGGVSMHPASNILLSISPEQRQSLDSTQDVQVI